MYQNLKHTIGVKIKKLHKGAVIPKYAKEGDAGLDLVATSREYDENGNLCYGTGLAFEIPEGYVGLLFPRSSNSKKDLILSNSVGIIDSCFRGEVMMKFKTSIRQLSLKSLLKVLIGIKGKKTKVYNIGDAYQIGDRIGQLIIMPFPRVEFEEVDELSESERGTGGYGSTGR